MAQHSIVQSRVPSDLDVVPCLALLHGLVIVSFQLHQGSENILVGIRILVPALQQATVKACQKRALESLRYKKGLEPNYFLQALCKFMDRNQGLRHSRSLRHSLRSTAVC